MNNIETVTETAIFSLKNKNFHFNKIKISPKYIFFD